MYSDEDTLAGGLPHSDIHGSTPARGSPWLFAACHVLHRLLVPRHPPNALLSLETRPPELIRRLPPCTETILSGQPPYRSPAKRSAPRKRITLAQHTTVASEHLFHRRDAETSGQTLRWQRPETHQNLIHPDKERCLQTWRHLRHRNSTLASQEQSHQCRSLSLLRDTTRSAPHPGP